MITRHPGWSAPHNLAGRLPEPLTDAEWERLGELLPGATEALRPFSEALHSGAAFVVRPRRRSTDPNQDRLIYVLCDPRDGEVRYVGQTINAAKRLKQHRKAHRASPRVARWVTTLPDGPEMVELEWCAGRQANRREQEWIKHYLSAGADLLNTVGIPAELLAA